MTRHRKALQRCTKKLKNMTNRVETAKKKTEEIQQLAREAEELYVNMGADADKARGYVFAMDITFKETVRILNDDVMFMRDRIDLAIKELTEEKMRIWKEYNAAKD